MRLINAPQILGTLLILVSGVNAVEPSACGDHGTAVKFLDTPSEAARQALKEEKLVFVLHISGHFEDPGLT